MDTWHIFRITDYNECPPVVTFYNEAIDRHDAMEEIRKTGKDPALIDLTVVLVKRKKEDFVDLLNAVAVSPRFAEAEPVEPVRAKGTFRHLRVVK